LAYEREELAMKLMTAGLIIVFAGMPLLNVADAKGREGGACHVVGGGNAGKSGTYDDEGACCDQAWGCTECGGSNQGKCKDGMKIGPSGNAGSAKKPIGGTVKPPAKKQ
jgi:hypothetical protein